MAFAKYCFPYMRTRKSWRHLQSRSDSYNENIQDKLGLSWDCVKKTEYFKMFPWLSNSHSVMSNSATPWTVILQAPPSMKFSRQECWSELSCPSPGILPEQEIKPVSCIAGGLFIFWATREVPNSGTISASKRTGILKQVNKMRQRKSSPYTREMQEAVYKSEVQNNNSCYR